MEDLFGYLALAFFVVIGIVEWLYKIADKRTSVGKYNIKSDNKIKTIYKNGTKFLRQA
jgi:hypothetical protein